VVTKKPITLNNFPYAVRPGLEDVASTDVVVIEHICLDQNLSPSKKKKENQREVVKEGRIYPTLVYHAAKSTSFLTPMAI
jgi:hypothetical protein